MKTKSQAGDMLKLFCANEGSCKRIHSDAEKVFLGGNFHRLITNLNIGFETSPPYAHWMNAIAECTWRVALNGVKAMLLDSMLPTIYWSLACHYRIYVLNHSIHGSAAISRGLVPEATWNARDKSSVSQLRAFGCLAFVRCDGHDNRDKHPKHSHASTYPNL